MSSHCVLRTSPTHASIYVRLFLHWDVDSLQHFKSLRTVQKKNILQVCKVKHRACIQPLTHVQWYQKISVCKYLEYINPNEIAHHLSIFLKATIFKTPDTVLNIHQTATKSGVLPTSLPTEFCSRSPHRLNNCRVWERRRNTDHSDNVR